MEIEPSKTQTSERREQGNVGRHRHHGGGCSCSSSAATNYEYDSDGAAASIVSVDRHHHSLDDRVSFDESRACAQDDDDEENENNTSNNTTCSDDWSSVSATMEEFQPTGDDSESNVELTEGARIVARIVDCDSSQQGDNESDYDEDESDYDDDESSYIYDEDDDEAQEVDDLLFGRAIITSSKESEGGVEAQLHELTSELGDDVASYCPVEAQDRVYGFDGFVYLIFPADSKGPLHDRNDLADAWGFDPEEAIVVRMNVRSSSALDGVPLVVRDLDLTAYQGGDEPPYSWRKQALASSHSSTGSTIEATTCTDASPNTTKKRQFRLGKQICAIAERFLVANWRGEGRIEGVLTLTQAHGEETFIQVLFERQATEVDQATSSLDTHIRPFLDQAKEAGIGILIRLYAYLNARIKQLHRFCVNCDHPHLEGPLLSAPVWPSVCRRELCAWAFTEMGVGRESTDEMAAAAEVVDLLLAITSAAATSHRNNLILNPFPLVLNGGRKVLDPAAPNFEKAANVARKLPSIQHLVRSHDEEQLEAACNEKGPYVYGLFRWITNSCPAHIVALTGGQQLLSMGTPYQYLIRSASMEKEQAFAAAKETHGSTFAFHGSGIENWHSILRAGVQTMSGTALQVNGAAYGKGVYVSPSASMSLSYSRVSAANILPAKATTGPDATRPPSPGHDGKNMFISGHEVRILALCELIDNGDLKKHGSVWVVPDDKNVVTRFLFVFLPASNGFSNVYRAANSCVTTDDAFAEEIRLTIGKTWGKKY